MLGARGTSAEPRERAITCCVPLPTNSTPTISSGSVRHMSPLTSLARVPDSELLADELSLEDALSSQGWGTSGRDATWRRWVSIPCSSAWTFPAAARSAALLRP